MRTLIAFLALSLWCYAQTPTLVNNVSGNNTLTSTLTTKNWDTGCANGTYCTHLADPSLSGNFIAVRVLYKDSPSTTISVTDDKGGGSSTYTAGPTAHDTTNGYWMAIFYTANAAAGILNISVNSTAAVGHVSVSASQWYNVATSTPIDTSAGNAGANGSTTMTSGSITPGTSGDLLLYWSCRTQTPAATSFTAGTGQSNVTWALLNGEADVIDGCMAQWGIYSSTSAINPQATTAAGSAYVAATMAIKAASAGTAPTGMYIKAISHTQVATGVGTTTTHQIPCTGNLLVLMSGGGGNRAITAVSSTPSNTWAATGAKNTDGNNSTRTWYAANANCSDSMTVTLTWDNSTGDSSILAYDIVGAATSPFRQRIAKQGSMTVANTTMFTTTDPNSFQTLGPQPGISNGLLIGMEIQNLNTTKGLSAPSGGVFDAISYGGQSLDGPSNGDQNNGWGHVYVSAPTILTWTWTIAQSNEDPGAYSGELDVFLSATGVTTPTYIQRCVNDTNTTSTTITLACTPTGAGHTWAIMASIANTAVTAIALTDTAGNTFVTADAATTVTSYAKVATFYVTAAVNSATTITATFTGQSGTHRHQLILLEFDGVDQTSPVDQHVLTNAAEDGSGNFSSGSVTTTYAYEALVGLMDCNSVCSGTASLGSSFNIGGEDTQGKAFAEWRLVSSTGSVTSSAKDVGVGGNSGAGLITLKGVQAAAPPAGTKTMLTLGVGQ